jgi:hypothetical protein
MVLSERMVDETEISQLTPRARLLKSDEVHIRWLKSLPMSTPIESTRIVKGVQVGLPKNDDLATLGGWENEVEVSAWGNCSTI